MQVSKNGNAIYLNVGVWYDPKDGQIHLTARDVKGFHTTVKSDGQSNRGHPNLFRKLAKCLKEAGAPAPEIPATDAEATST
jgi:hypothetical protein